MVDPIVVFTRMLGKAMVMYAAQVAEIARAHTYGAQDKVIDSGVVIFAHGFDAATTNVDVQRAIQASCDFIQLSRLTGPINCFKVRSSI
ncbi:hypothetical protein BDV19DRAFT_372509 [Aspergillus venezuelensis]